MYLVNDKTRQAFMPQYVAKLEYAIVEHYAQCNWSGFHLHQLSKLNLRSRTGGFSLVWLLRGNGIYIFLKIHFERVSFVLFNSV